jgi:hypothetical protein
MLEREPFVLLRKLYETANMLSANDGALFTTSFDDFLQQPWQVLRSWTSIAWPTAEACLQSPTDHILRQHPRIAKIFHPDTAEHENGIKYNTGKRDLQNDIDIKQHQQAMTATKDISYRDKIHERIVTHNTMCGIHTKYQVGDVFKTLVAVSA